jgi:hypothetical protein
VSRKSLGDEYVVERPFGPSKAEQKQTLKMVITIVGALIILVVGVTLRYTVFADAFKPKTLSLPAASPTAPSASPSATPSPE